MPMPAPATMSDLQWELLLNAITAGFASFAGAYGAWKISSRSDRRRRISDEIVDANIAVAISHTVTNKMLALKGQQVVGLLERYQAVFEKYWAILQQAAAPGAPLQVFTLIADFQNSSVPYVAADDLQKAVERVRRSTSAPIILASLQTAIEGLRQSSALRNDLSQRLRGSTPEVMVTAYFGTRTGAGNFDQSYPDALTQIGLQTDDCIYFSMLLSEILMRHGKTLRKEYGFRAPKIVRLDYSSARIQGLLPKVSEYRDFEAQFRPPASPEVRAPIAWYMAHHEGLLQKGLRWWSSEPA
jgi:hypothetical protein